MEQEVEVFKSSWLFAEHQEYVLNNCLKTGCKGAQSLSDIRKIYIRWDFRKVPNTDQTNTNVHFLKQNRTEALPRLHVLEFANSTAQNLFYLICSKVLFNSSIPLGFYWFLRGQYSVSAHVCMCLGFWRAVLTNILRISWHCTETMPKKKILNPPPPHFCSRDLGSHAVYS